MVMISEIFPGQQWEGREVGRTTIFIRFLKCNMKPRCKWCDVIDYEGSEYSWEEIVKKIQINYPNINHITWTGGEPSIHQEFIENVMMVLGDKYSSSVETNGLIFINPSNYNIVSCSPKIQNINDDVLNNYRGYNNVIFKLVVENEKSYKEWFKLIKRLKLNKDQIYMMPEGITSRVVRYKTKWLSDLCIGDGFNLSTRVQYLLYGNKKGV